MCAAFIAVDASFGVNLLLNCSAGGTLDDLYSSLVVCVLLHLLDKIEIAGGLNVFRQRPESTRKKILP